MKHTAPHAAGGGLSDGGPGPGDYSPSWTEGERHFHVNSEMTRYSRTNIGIGSGRAGRAFALPIIAQILATMVHKKKQVVNLFLIIMGFTVVSGRFALPIAHGSFWESCSMISHSQLTRLSLCHITMLKVTIYTTQFV